MSEQVAIVKGELDKLPPDHKAAFILRTYDNLSYEEISKIMGCSLGTVMSRLFRARHKLQDALRNWESQPEMDESDEEM
jgi:RNA polymerase sigma-70 factor (ECF subfamily)